MRARAGALSRAAINQMGIGPIFPAVSLGVVVGFSRFSCYFRVFYLFKMLSAFC